MKPLIFSILITLSIVCQSNYLPPFYVIEEDKCELTSNYKPEANNIEGYEWKHITSIPYLEGFPVSTFIYSSTNESKMPKAVIHFCSSFTMHMVNDERDSEVLNKIEEWVNPLMSYDYEWSDPDCVYKKHGKCVFTTIVFIKDDKTQYEIPVKIELFFDSEKSLEKMFDWVKSLEVNYLPKKSFQSTDREDG